MAQLKDTLIQGSARVTDTLYGSTVELTSLIVPSATNSSTYSTGSAGQVLKSNGSTVYWDTMTPDQLNLANAMHFIGKATVAITDGSTTNPTISGYDFTNKKAAGDVIIDKDTSYEYVWTTENKWERLGGDSSYKVVQTAVTKPSAATNKWVSAIGQDTNGNITVDYGTLVTTGTWSGNATTATTATQLSFKNGRIASADLDISTMHSKMLLTLASSSMTTSKPPMGDGYIVTYGWDNAYWGAQQAISHTKTPHMAIRGTNGGSTNDWGDWIYLLDANNYSSYTYALDGSNTGTKLRISTQISAYTNGIQFMNGTTKKGSIGTDNNGVIGIYGTKVVLRPQLDASTQGIEVTADAMYPTASMTLGTTSKKWSTVYATTFNGTVDHATTTLDNTSVLHPVGVTSSAKTTLKYDDSIAMTGGQINAEKFRINDQARFEYNSTDDSIDLIWG